MNINEILSKNETVIGALLYLYGYQTPDEQQVHSTTYDNGVGFNAFDATILSSISKFYLEKGFISEKQLAIVKSKIQKYQNQLSCASIQEYPIKKQDKTQTTQQIKKAEETLDKTQLILSFPYDAVTVAKVKTIPFARFNKDSKNWTIPNSLENIKRTQELGFTIDLKGSPPPKPLSEIKSVPGLKIDLFPYQLEGVQFLENKNGRALIADEMGLGKTIQALAWLQLHPEKIPAIVLCPQSIKLNWVKEAKKFTTIKNIWVVQNGKDIEQLHGLEKKYDLIVCNYDLITKHLGFLLSINPQVVILDESSYIKNPQAQRTKMARQITKIAPHVICLSGTPIINRPIEMFTSINAIAPNQFPNRFAYGKRYCNLHQTRWGYDWNGASNLQELNDVLTSTIMIRRKKQEVLKDLPEKIRSIIPVELSNHSEYFHAERDFISWVCKNYGREKMSAALKAETLVKLEYLKQLSFKGKTESIIDFLDDFYENHPNEKITVFAVHKSAIDALMQYGEKYNAVKIDGSCSSEQRQKAVEKFQNDPNCLMFVGNIKAAGMGITLTAASNSLFVELPWTPGEMIQAEDRQYRIGTKNTVNIYFMVADKSIELKMMNILDNKTKTLSQVLDGEESQSSSLLTELLSDYYNGEK